MNPNQCCDNLLQVLDDNNVKIANKRLLLYLPGGIPFLAGTLSEIFANKTLKAKKVIYGVLICNVSEKSLNERYYDIYKIYDFLFKLQFTPQCNSTDRGLSDIACLLGYINHGGEKSSLLHKTTSSIIHFPPLITSMAKIIENDNIEGRDIVTFCSTFFTFFRGNLPPSINDNSVFEYALRICNLITNIVNVPEKLPLIYVEIDSNNENTKFLSNLKVGSFVYVWRADLGFDEFLTVDLDLTKSFDSIKNSYEEIKTFIPLAPLSIFGQSSCSIVRGNNHEYLYLMQSPLKKYNDRTIVEIIDPIARKTICEDVEIFAREQATNNEFNPDSIKEIIMVNLDESSSMLGNIKGNLINKKSKDIHRVTISNEYLSIFASRIYGNHLPFILGLVTFNDKINVRCPLTPFVSDFERNLIRISPNSTTKLWDSLSHSCDEIAKFRKDSQGNEKYKNANQEFLSFLMVKIINHLPKLKMLSKNSSKIKLLLIVLF